jgi:hypothetical protein
VLQPWHPPNSRNPDLRSVIRVIRGVLFSLEMAMCFAPGGKDYTPSYRDFMGMGAVMEWERACHRIVFQGVLFICDHG